MTESRPPGYLPKVIPIPATVGGAVKHRSPDLVLVGHRVEKPDRVPSKGCWSRRGGKASSLSPAYMAKERATGGRCFCRSSGWPVPWQRANAGQQQLARIAMMAITTSNSISSVNAATILTVLKRSYHRNGRAVKNWNRLLAMLRSPTHALGQAAWNFAAAFCSAVLSPLWIVLKEAGTAHSTTLPRSQPSLPCVYSRRASGDCFGCG